MDNGQRLTPIKEDAMLRRAFLKSLAALVGGFALPAIASAGSRSETWKTLQTSPLAGFQYHSGETLWPQLATGQPLTLTREADNRFDDRAVRVDWQDHKLGYIPRLDNAAASQLLDRGKHWRRRLSGWRTAVIHGTGLRWK